MTAIISTTHDPLYQFFLPITTWCWNKLGVHVICFAPEPDSDENNIMLNIGLSCIDWGNSKNEIEWFSAPKHKEATYAQCSRLYAACLDLPEDELLIVGDVDMCVFRLPEFVKGTFSVFGADLVPEKQMPMCYLIATVQQWRETFDIRYVSHDIPDSLFSMRTRTYQECLDDLLGNIECESFRGNYWGKDQEEAYNKITKNRPSYTAIKRAREGTQFATHRIDRDDAYFLDRLNWDVVDYHMHRPGYTAENVEKIIKVISYFYPYDDLTWIREYAEKYRELV